MVGIRSAHNGRLTLKTIKYLFFGLLSLISVASFAQSNNQDEQVWQAIQQLHWIHGPSEVQIGSRATLQVPKGFAYLNSADAAKFMMLVHNPDTGGSSLLAPEDLSWFTLFEFDNIGYVKDTTKINADDVLAGVKKGTEAENQERRKRGWPTMTVLGWRYPPRYNSTEKRLEWAIDGEDSNNEEVINYNTRILGRSGVMAVQLVTAPANLDTAVNQLNSALDRFNFVPDEVYSAYRPGDKIAEYGLAGLITGGAVAVAAKTGILKWLFKFIWVGIIALIAAIKVFFGRIKKLFVRNQA